MMNVTTLTSYHLSLCNLNIPQYHLPSSILILTALIDSICNIFGTIILLIIVGVCILCTLCHIIKGYMQYNVLLVSP